jgi:ABC-2 type transport system permease protein
LTASFAQELVSSLRTVFAFVRASWLVASSYRVQLVLSLGGLVVSVVPLFFVARALQSTMSGVIAGEGTQYFGFVLIGTVAFMFVSEATNSLPGSISASIGSGVFDTILMAPTPLPVTLAGLTAYGFVFAGVRALCLLVAGALFGTTIAWANMGLALLVVALIVLAYTPFGVLAGALIVAFRTAGPLNGLVLLSSGLLGGVYYPTRVIPSWIRSVADVIPLSYGLRALRRLLLENASLGDVGSDLLSLTLFAALSMGVAVIAMSLALRYAKRAGTLSQY